MTKSAIDFGHMLTTILLLLSQSTAFAAPSSIELARTLVAFEGNGFSCAIAPKARGMMCKGSFKPDVYPEPVAFFVPLNYKVPKHAEVILHLHGWVDDGETLDDTIRKFRFSEALAKTHRNAILVVPRSNGHCDTFKTLLVHPHIFNNFLDHVLHLLVDARLAESPDLGDLTLTAHSGSYSTLEAILTRRCSPAVHTGCYVNHVKEVFLFDSLYDAGDGFVKFANEAPPFRFVSVFIPLKKKNGNWKWTAAGNHLLWAQLNPTADDSTFIESTLPPDAPLEAIARAAAKGPTFMRSDESHDPTFNKYFPRLLRAVHHQ